MSIVFRDSFRSTTVTNDGKKVTCAMTTPSTNYSEQVFSSSNDCFTVVVRVHRRSGGTVTVGIVGDDQTDECSRCTPGDPEIEPSMGFRIMEGEVQLRSSKHGRFLTLNCNTTNPTDILMCFTRGRVSFRVDDRHVKSETLAAIRFYGCYRIGVSVVKQGECAEIIRFNPGGEVLRSLALPSLRRLVGSGDAFPLEDYKGSGAFHFVDRALSIDLYQQGEQQQFVCRRTTNATVFSREVFSESQDIDQCVAVTNLARGAVAFGIIGHEFTENGGGCFLGELKQPYSIALILSENHAVIGFRSEVKARARCDTRGMTLLRLTVSGGRLRFYVDMQEVECPWLQAMSLQGRYRLGVSLGREGQRVVHKPLDAGLLALQAAVAFGGEAAKQVKAQKSSSESNFKVSRSRTAEPSRSLSQNPADLPRMAFSQIVSRRRANVAVDVGHTCFPFYAKTMILGTCLASVWFSVTYLYVAHNWNKHFQASHG